MIRPFIEICVSCHQFQKRWNWQLLSILQQKNFDVSRVLISVAYIKGTGSPSVVQTINHFEDKLKFHLVEYPDHEEFQYRGYVRNRQVKESTGEWLFFTDADMLLNPFFMRHMETLTFLPVDKCLYTGRLSTDLESTEKLVNSIEYPATLPHAWEKASALPSVKKANIGAGFCQIISGDFMRNRGYYVKPGTSKDWNWDKKHSKCKSDHQFRREVGKQEVNLPWMIHLQHRRDSMFGRHIDDQR